MDGALLTFLLAKSRIWKLELKLLTVMKVDHIQKIKKKKYNLIEISNRSSWKKYEKIPLLFFWCLSLQNAKAYTE